MHIAAIRATEICNRLLIASVKNQSDSSKRINVIQSMIKSLDFMEIIASICIIERVVLFNGQNWKSESVRFTDSNEYETLFDIGSELIKYGVFRYRSSANVIQLAKNLKDIDFQRQLVFAVEETIGKAMADKIVTGVYKHVGF